MPELDARTYVEIAAHLDALAQRMAGLERRLTEIEKTCIALLKVAQLLNERQP